VLKVESNNPASPKITLERRRQPRFMTELPVGYRRSNDSRLHPGHEVSFGEVGLMILVSEQMKMGESL
jgi:hypothetical protein